MKLVLQSSYSTIETAADIERGVRALSRACPAMRRIHKLTGMPPLRREAAGFQGLAGIVIAQQVSAASADAIWRRTQRTLGTVSAKTVSRTDDATLRSCGLSAPKARTLRAVTEAVQAGQLDFKQLNRAPDDEIHATLTAIKGIGPWSADIYIMFCLGRADAWAAGDLALQVAIARIFELRDKPSAEEALTIAERWRPWRGVAARMLWSLHAVPRSAPGKTTWPAKSTSKSRG